MLAKHQELQLNLQKHELNWMLAGTPKTKDKWTSYNLNHQQKTFSLSFQGSPASSRMSWAVTHLIEQLIGLLHQLVNVA